MANPEITSPSDLMEAVNAFRISRIILTANELGVFDHLQGAGLPSSKIAASLNTHPRATDRLLNALAAIGLLDKKHDHFVNTGFSSRYLVKNSASYLGGLSLSNQSWKTWSSLTDAVRKGTTVVMDSPINERNDEWRDAFIAAMHTRGTTQANEVVRAIGMTGVSHALDVGGGSGVFSFEMLRSNPEMHATIFDLPNIIPLTQQYVQSSGFSGRINTISGDYLTGNLGHGYDLVFMSAIIHINSPGENQLLIWRGAEALNKGGRLVVLDHIMDEDRTSPRDGAVFALNMLVGTFHGDTYTESEIRSWMHDAGLEKTEMKVTPSGIQIMIGHKI